MAVLSERINQYYRQFSRDLGRAQLAEQMVDVDYEWELDEKFFEQDTNEMLDKITEVKNYLQKIRDALK